MSGAPASAAVSPAVRRRWGRGALSLLMAALWLWAALALEYQFSGLWRIGLQLLWSAATLAGLVALWRPQASVTGPWAYGLALLLLLVWWCSLRPSQTRDWSPDVSRSLQVEGLDGGPRIRLVNVRNFQWQTAERYEARWETREYDLDGLVSADLLLSYWMGPSIAHTLVSFGFADGRYLTFSLEIRKERQERFSALGGFFRQFEQVMIAADERDIVRLRTNVRGEEVILYRLNVPPEGLRTAFLGYLRDAEALRRAPEFYNTLTSNCTTIPFGIARRFAPGLPLDARLLLSGHFAEYVFDQGGLTPGYDFQRLTAAGRMTERARAAGDATDFSRRIRLGVPGIAAPEALPAAASP
jgi:hypothetical protein